jgi:hypothetical protein
MRADLLIKGAELLEADAAKGDGVRFDLSTWASPYDPYRPDPNFDTQDTPPLNCNTKACAMGLFCLSGAFTKEGLGYDLEAREFGGYVLNPTCRGDEGYAAAAELFEITNDDADTLFSPDSYDITKGADAERAVAARMRALAAGEEIFPDYMEHDED